MLKGIGAFRGQRLPFSPIKVKRDLDGKRVIEGVSTFVDSHPEIPFGRMVGEKWICYSKEERSALIAKADKRKERNEKRAAKGLPPIGVKAPKEKAVKPAFTPETVNVPTLTVKRGGKWVQVSQEENLGIIANAKKGPQ